MESKIDLFYKSFIDAIYENTKGSYGGRFPMPYFSNFEIEMVTGKFWIDKFLDILKKIEDKNISFEGIAERIKYPSFLTRAVIPNDTLKFLKISKNKIMMKDRSISEIIFSLYKEYPFCKESKNILWNVEDIEKNFKRDKLLKIQGHPNGYLRTITEFLYFYSDNLGHEFHGPYILNNGDKLLVREWYNLDAPYYNFSKDFSPSEIRIYELYNSNAEIEIDISNRLIVGGTLKGSYLEVDKKVLSLKETNELIDFIIKKCREATKEVLSLNRQELFKKACLMQFYMLKPLADLAEVDWEPSKDCLNRIKEGIKEEDKTLFRIVKSASLTKEMIQMLFDYRLDLPEQ